MPLATLLALLSPTWADSLMAIAAGEEKDRKKEDEEVWHLQA